MLHCYCPNIGTAFRSAYFGEGTGSIVMNDVHCNGTERYITNCTHNTEHNCNPNEVAGVRCACKYCIMVVFLCIVLVANFNLL